MKVKFDPLIIFFFGLVAGIILSPLVRAEIASAQSNSINQVSTSTFAFSFGSTDGSEAGSNSSIFFYKAIYPSEASSVAGATAGGGFTGTRLELFKTISPDNCDITGQNAILCDLEPFLGQVYGDGNYWVKFLTPNVSPTTIVEWYQITRTGGKWSTNYQPSLGSNNIGYSRNTRFLAFSATSTATTTTNDPVDLNLDISWYLDSREVNRSVSSLNPTGVKIRWVQTNISGEEARTFAISSTTGTSSDSFILDEFPANGAFTFVVTFTNIGCDLRINSCPFPDSYLYLDILMASGTIASSTAVEFYDTVNVTPEQETCSITNISACINNALIFLFVPSGDALNEYINLGDRLDSVKPFGYFTQALDAIGGVSTSTSAYTMPEIPFQTAIFDPLRDGMSVMLWGIFAFVFYNKRLKNIDI